MSITEIRLSVLLEGIIVVCCENHNKHKYTVWGEMQRFCLLKAIVLTVTIHLNGLTEMNEKVPWLLS
jgi:hypothetical protein